MKESLRLPPVVARKAHRPLVPSSPSLSLSLSSAQAWSAALDADDPNEESDAAFQWLNVARTYLRLTSKEGSAIVRAIDAVNTHRRAVNPHAAYGYVYTLDVLPVLAPLIKKP